MLTISDLVDLDRRAVERSVEIVDAVTIDLLGRPTPCAGWNLADLLAHMIAQHYGFAAAAEGNTTDRSVWNVHPVDGEPAVAYTASARRVMEAFAAPGAPLRAFWLPEIRGGGSFPAEMAIGFHFVDYVVHGWDVAASLDIDAGYAPDLVDAALSIAEQVPTGIAREVLDTPFGAPLVCGRSKTRMERMLLLLGRSPTWPDQPATSR